MGQGNSNNDILGVLQIGFDSVREEIHELEKLRDKLYKDVNLPKEVDRLTKEVSDLEAEKIKLREDIQFIVAEKSASVKTAIEEEIKPLNKVKTTLLATLSKLKVDIKVLEGDQDKVKSDITVLAAKGAAYGEYVSEEKKKLEDYAENFKRKVISKTKSLDVREENLNKSRGKLEEDMTILVGREERLKSEELANDELIKGSLKDLEYREQGVADAKAQLEAEKVKSLDAHSSRNSDLNRREAAIKVVENNMETVCQEVDKTKTEVTKRETAVTSKEKDLEVNWAMFLKEQEKFKYEKRKFLSK